MFILHSRFLFSRSFFYLCDGGKLNHNQQCFNEIIYVLSLKDLRNSKNERQHILPSCYTMVKTKLCHVYWQPTTSSKTLWEGMQITHLCGIYALVVLYFQLIVIILFVYLITILYIDFKKSKIFILKFRKLNEYQFKEKALCHFFENTFYYPAQQVFYILSLAT